MSATLLVVEDEPLVLLFVEDVLAEDGSYNVLSAKNADEALSIIEANPDIDLVFSDINMPGSMDGLELAYVVHARSPDMPIVIASGRGVPDALPPQARFLLKPYRGSTLLKTIGEMLKLVREGVSVAELSPDGGLQRAS